MHQGSPPCGAESHPGPSCRHLFLSLCPPTPFLRESPKSPFSWPSLPLSFERPTLVFASLQRLLPPSQAPTPIYCSTHHFSIGVEVRVATRLGRKRASKMGGAGPLAQHPPPPKLCTTTTSRLHQAELPVALLGRGTQHPKPLRILYEIGQTPAPPAFPVGGQGPTSPPPKKTAICFLLRGWCAGEKNRVLPSKGVACGFD